MEDIYAIALLFSTNVVRLITFARMKINMGKYIAAKLFYFGSDERKKHARYLRFPGPILGQYTAQLPITPRNFW
jgi:hypothetical protein